MSALSGIGVSEELVQAFSSAVESKDVRFIKIIIQNESLVPATVLNISGSLDEDLAQLEDILEDTEPAYVLARLDEPQSEWLVINYVPESAKVRDKMLYASTRNSLTKSLGSAVFTDSLYATAKSDLSPEAYAAHKRHTAAPKPLSAREQEMADIKAAEREAGNTYEGSRGRQNHLGTGVGLSWSTDAEEAIKALMTSDSDRLVIIKIEPSTESLVLELSSNIGVEQLSSSLPVSEPCYAFLAWANSPSSTGKDIVFIYSCPSSSPIKYRMVYSSGVSGVFQRAKAIFNENPSSFTLASKKIETSDPKELDEAYLKSELGFDAAAEVKNTNDTAKTTFARPKGPGRRR
ncbi:actin depolymerizing protein [Hygrophoropsis aurantiaca]|uniref:Actin depolymerizing protein n=1 Tax=Hygrophoropsis aurantiaca TaxID=72124 RepID=A0ACB8A679_9AGAM|nr:actin depolymerizing protein [Hygrophoropsis aurantiaca]